MVRQILPQDVRARIDRGLPVYLLDVRQPEEYAIARLPGSTLIPLDELPRRAGEVEPPTGATIIVYCHHGIRSLSGAAILQQFGLENVFSMVGGIEAWAIHVDPAVPRY